MSKRLYDPRQEKWECAKALKHFMATSEKYNTQVALARRSGVPQSTIGRILRAEVATQTATISLLIQALGIMPMEFWQVAQGDRPKKGDRVPELASEVMSKVLMARGSRRRAEEALAALWQRENELKQVLERCQLEEDQALERHSKLAFGHQARRQGDRDGMEGGVRA